MFDWMTLTIEAIGIVIVCIWTILPAQEFRQIFTAIRQREQERHDRH